MWFPCKEFSIAPSKLPFYFSASNLSLNFLFVSGLNMYHSNDFFRKNTVVEQPCINSAYLWPIGGCMPREKGFLALYSLCFIYICVTKIMMQCIFSDHIYYLKTIGKHVAATEVYDVSLISWHTLQGINQFGEGAGLQSWKLLHPGEARRSVPASSPNVLVHASPCCCSLPPLNSSW